MNVTETEEDDFTALAARHSLDTLHRHFDAWLKFQRELAYAPQPRWLLEAQVIRLAQLEPLIPMTEMVERLGRLLTQNPPPRLAVAVAVPVAIAPPLPPVVASAPPSADQTADRLEVLKKDPEMQSLVVNLPGTFIEFRPTGPEPAAESEEQEADLFVDDADDDTD
jgi:DNA polymerase III gamma/tau subunit